MQAMGKEHGVVERTVWSWPHASLDPLQEGSGSVQSPGQAASEEPRHMKKNCTFIAYPHISGCIRTNSRFDPLS